MDEEQTGVVEEQTEGVREKKLHKVALGGKLFAAFSVLFLVPVIRRMRERRRQRAALEILLLVPVVRRMRAQRHHKHRRHFPIVGH